MRYIYMDNFRGFKETLLPLKDINFFVGENSSGKTSVLSLLYLFHSEALWVGGRFYDEDEGIELGNFDDIVSMNTKDRGYFSIGAMFPVKKKGVPEYIIFLMTFTNKEGLPNVKYYSVGYKNKRVDIHFTSNSTMYRIKDIKTIDEEPNTIKETFLNWNIFHKEIGSGFKKLTKRRLGRFGTDTLFRIIDRWLGIKPVNKWDISNSWPSLYPYTNWIAPIRTKPLKIYYKNIPFYSSEGTHTPYVIKKVLETKRVSIILENYINKFGKESGLFESVRITKYGREKTGPFKLEIILSGTKTNITNVGYGVSQILPIVIEIFMGLDRTAYAIQQPEIHLHPRAQAAFGDLLYNLATSEKKTFMIETHSDFIIDRFRMNYRKNRKNKPESQIVFFENNVRGNFLSVINISENGSLPKEQPKAFRDFFLKEQMKILGF